MDHRSLHPLTRVRPRLRAVRRAADALGLQARELLHAGPPLADPRRPPPVLASSVVVTCLHEGWAATEAEAEALLRDGALALSPAQERGCVTPLAAVVSAGTPLFEVDDAAGPGPACHAPVGAVRGADTRMGWRDPGLPARLRHRDEVVAPALRELIDRTGPLALWPLAAAGLAGGDDLHGITTQANRALVERLRGLAAPAPVVDDIDATPLFFLTLWMAACARVLRAADGQAPATLVTRAGGNGERFAIALAGRPGHWTACAAVAPTGPRLPSAPPDARVAAAIGDSAVIDMLGFGGQRLLQAPELRALFADHAEAEATRAAAPAQRLLTSPHPALPDAWPLGLDAARVAAHRQAPRVMLAMLAQDGRTGLCGRGVYRPPVTLFEAALAAAAGPDGG